jgi:hypothetical protein
VDGEALGLEEYIVSCINTIMAQCSGMENLCEENWKENSKGEC